MLVKLGIDMVYGIDVDVVLCTCMMSANERILKSIYGCRPLSMSGQFLNSSLLISVSRSMLVIETLNNNSTVK